MKLDPRHLAQLAAIVEAGGMTEAAALTGTTQPALSRTVAQIEARLGEPLFRRGRRPLEPTPLGRALAEQGAAIRIAADRAGKAITAFRQGEGGAIRVGGTPFFMDALISGMVAAFQKAHADVRVDQAYGYTPELIPLVRSGRLDLAICPVEVLEAGSDLAFERLLPGRNVIACRCGHPLLARRSLPAAALLDSPWIEPPPGSPLNADLRTALLALGADRVRIAYAGGSLASIVNHLRGSDSLTVLPHSVVFAMRDAQAVSALPLRLTHPSRALGILRSRAPGGSRAADRFAAHVQAAFAELAAHIRRHERSLIAGEG